MIYKGFDGVFHSFIHEGVTIDLCEYWIEDGWSSGEFFYADDSNGREIKLPSETINRWIVIIRKDFPELLL